ncbi:MAG TPA: C-terminal binding protein [Gaiellaceae bacterium]|nr:C-terminal binding protein [Gaiellaceae bacterium]
MSRVLVVDPAYPLDDVREILDGRVDVEAAAAPWEGDDVVGLLTGPDFPVGEAELARLPGLKVVATCSVGYDHVDLQAAAARGVWVCNVRDYCVEEMADSSLALLLALLRGVVTLDRRVRAGEWDHTVAGPLRTFRGTKLAIIGFGRIGRAVAERSLALGFEVWAVDPHVPEDEITAAGARPASLDEALESCETFSLHAFLTEETRGMIGAEELDRMSRGSYLVDTSRAALVDFDAVLAALDSGQLAGAAFDVLPVEPPTPDAPAPQHPRLIVNPHAAWYSPATEKEAYRRPAVAVREALEGRRPADAL